jgi:hypothetical protein
MHWSVCAFLMVCMFPANKLPSAAWTRCWYVPFLQTCQPILFPVMVFSCSYFFLCLKCVLSLLLSVTSYISVSIVVPAEWSAWSAWSDCSVTCGLGERVRARVCGEDAEEFVDESNCQGKPEQIQSCYMSECPVSKADK